MDSDFSTRWSFISITEFRKRMLQPGYAPFGSTAQGYRDFRGLDAALMKGYRLKTPLVGAGFNFGFIHLESCDFTGGPMSFQSKMRDCVLLSGSSVYRIAEDCHACLFEECDATECDVQGQIRDCRFLDVDFRRSRWGNQPTTIEGCTLINCNFVRSQMRNVMFKSCTLENCDIRRSELYQVSFLDCVMKNVDFRASHAGYVTGIDLSGVKVDLERTA